mgnify:CR=1 FL=1
MFNSLLNANTVNIDSLILNIFIILGVVIAGAVIVYLLWEAVNTLVNKNKKTDEAAPTAQPKKEENVFVSDYKLEEEAQKQPVVLIDDNKLVDVDEDKAEEEKTEIEEENVDHEKEEADRRAYLEARRQELIRRMQQQMDEEPEEAEAQAEEVEEEAEVEETPVVEEAEEQTEEKTQDDSLEEERQALLAEKERYEMMVRELENAKKALAEQQAEIAATQVETQPVQQTEQPALSLDELKERLANAEERLKATEKEFRQCKKEYIPLRRIWKTHEKDEKRLRRKEALVAKQKAMLYSVNNYADIDEEKAKKLAEDLDLYDGLKLSVQHCEEVMKKNEERYPLLEKMYNVLKLRNDELKNDIATYKAEIERLEAEQNSEEQDAE